MDDSRIKKLAKNLEIPCFIERTADLLYLTGMAPSKGRLYISPSEAQFYVDGRYYEQAKKKAPCSVLLWDEQKKISAKQIGFDSATVTYEAYLSLQSNFPKVEWVPMPNPLKEIRILKEKREIEALKKAAHLTWRGYQTILAGLKEGITEESLALEFEIFCRKEGASGLSFEPIIAFGPNSAYPHYRAGKSRLEQGQLVLIDVGAVVDDYHGDMTRIFYFGKPDPKIVDLERIVRRAKKKAIEQIKPGVKIGELDQLVRDEFAKENVLELYSHTLGHGVGLETHEYPRINYQGEDKNRVLEAGMVFTIEPGLYQPGLGGVRLEDMVLVTEMGHENFFMDE